MGERVQKRCGGPWSITAITFGNHVARVVQAAGRATTRLPPLSSQKEMQEAGVKGRRKETDSQPHSLPPPLPASITTRVRFRRHAICYVIQFLDIDFCLLQSNKSLWKYSRQQPRPVPYFILIIFYFLIMFAREITSAVALPFFKSANETETTRQKYETKNSTVDCRLLSVVNIFHLVCKPSSFK